MDRLSQPLVSMLGRLLARTPPEHGAPPFLLDGWLVAADALIERGSPAGFSLAAGLAALREPPGSTERARLDGEAQRLQRAPLPREAASAPRDLRQQLLLALSACGELVPLVDLLVAGGDRELVFVILAASSYCRLAELEPWHALVACDLRAMLDDIDAGVLTLVAACEGPPSLQVGYVSYRVSNGWSLSIYNRAYHWHYLASFTSPSGLVLALTDFTLPSALAELLEDYEPCDEVLSSVYGF